MVRKILSTAEKIEIVHTAYSKIMLIGIRVATITTAFFIIFFLYKSTTENIPVRYIQPFVVDKSITYHPGDQVYLTVHFCLSDDIEYSITQTFVDIETGKQFPTDSLNNLQLRVDNMKNFPDSYMTDKDFNIVYDEDGAYWFCRIAPTVPKNIPKNIVPNRYYLLDFQGVVSAYKKHYIHYTSEKFYISSPISL